MRGLVLSSFVGSAVAAACLVAGAPAASADQTWHQGVGRASADAPCPVADTADAAAGWSPWAPSWAQWANDGAGGFVCTRSTTWAFEAVDGPPVGPSYPSAWCEFSGIGGNFLQFGGGWGVNGGGGLYDVYDDAACTQVAALPFEGSYVYAPAGYDAQELCRELIGGEPSTTQFTQVVWRCYAA